MIVLACATWAIVHEFELPGPEIGASDKGGFVNSLSSVSEIVVTCSTLEKRLSSVLMGVVGSAPDGICPFKMRPGSEFCRGECSSLCWLTLWLDLVWSVSSEQMNRCCLCGLCTWVFHPLLSPDSVSW